MLRNYLITAFRTFKKNKTYSVLNILGLGIGTAGCLFVFTLINFEYSFDRFQSKKDRIYRVVRHYHGDNGISYSGIIPYPTGDAIVENIPDFEKVVQFHGPEDEKLGFTDKLGNYQIFREKQILYTDENFFDVLDFKILQGATPEILKEPFKIFLTKKIATKYFKDENPIGKTIHLNNEEKLTVVGVLQDPPQNTNLPFNVIISLPTMRQRFPDIYKDNWGMTWAASSYVLVQKNANIPELEAKLDQMMAKYDDDDDKDSGKLQMKLQPLDEIHNDERYGDGNHYVTPSMLIYAFILLGVLLLGTACLNFINLSTAQATRRAREVGVRKTLGSGKIELILQFMTETLVVVIIALVIGLTLGQVLISRFNQFLTDIEYNLTYSPEVIFFAIGLAVIVTFLAGFYPSLILAGYQPAEALTNKINLKKGAGNFNLRRGLVITQFAFTNLMLICTIIIAAQMDFMKSKDLGFNYENVLLLDFPEKSLEKIRSVKGELSRKSYVKDLAIGYTAPLSRSNWTNSYAKVGGEFEDGNNANMKFGTPEFLDFYDIEILEGRNVHERILTDTTFETVVNEKLVSSLGWTNEEAIGQWVDMGYIKMKIVGVMENFNVYTLQRNVIPAAFSYQPGHLEQISIRFKEEPSQEMISDIEETFRAFFPSELFESTVLSTQISEQYMLENMLHQIVQFVSVIAILLSGMGLYGLVSFMVNRNSKSIGIRKVFGASTSNILQIFGKEYALLLLFSFILAAPAGWWLSSLWIEEFAFRIDISLIYFAIAFLLSLAIALLTVGYRSYKAATSNPVESLRYE